MKNKDLMQKLLFYFIFSSSLIPQSDNNFNFEKSNLGLNISYNNENLFLDGSFYYDIIPGFFSELSFNEFSLDNNNTIFYNSSFGFVKNLSFNKKLGLGYSNYFNNFSEIEHELFFGLNFNYLTGFIYYDLEINLISYQAMIDLNTIFKASPLEIDVSFTHNNLGTDSFLEISKLFNRKLSIGYILSREKYDTNQEKTYIKKGETGKYNIKTQGMSFFHEVYINVYF